MDENALTQRFCIPCMLPIELRDDPHGRRWVCPGCGAAA